VFVWLEVGDDVERRKAELLAGGKLMPGQQVHFVSWKANQQLGLMK